MSDVTNIASITYNTIGEKDALTVRILLLLGFIIALCKTSTVHGYSFLFEFKLLVGSNSDSGKTTFLLFLKIIGSLQS